ncbi:site-specific DNA-methyltransferase [Candidatus Bathyarchaeota archaeon]|nr:site-specific DNA-methyltransferase [Candidatus Bathyarchaeota archaeon]
MVEIETAVKQENQSQYFWKPIFLEGISAYYRTHLGAAYHGDSKNLLKQLPEKSVNLIMTSPPFALRRKKEYGNVEAEEYVEWFMPFAEEFKRVLVEDGSLVIHIGGGWLPGKPRKALYNFELLLALSKEFTFIQDFYWYNPAKLPTPAEWVTVRRLRIKDAVDPIWWFSKIDIPKADNRKVLKPYSESMLQLFENGYKPKLRPSGHRISDKFNRRHSGAIPPNLLSISNTDSNSRYLSMCRKLGIKLNPARYPPALPEFFIKFLTDEGDVILDPFGGSNTTGAVAENLNRRWLCFEIEEEYLKGSIFRFDPVQIVETRTSIT